MRKILFCSLATLATLSVQARQLTPAEALTRAIGGEAVSYTSPSRGGDIITLAYTCKDASTGNNGLYVFNRAAGDGFLVVSADDVVQPLLGYADVGEFETSDMPDNLRAWLEEYTAQIAWASTMTATPSRAAGERRPSRASIKPMCVTMWNQNSPYNDLCPLYQGDRCVTGCVATAMAQILKYHNYPVHGTGSHSYTTDSLKLSAGFDFANTVFEWSKMLPSYTDDAKADEKTAVATLMYAAGVSVDMDYRPDESGASSFSVGNALINYFNYDKGVSYRDRNWYGMYEWEHLVYESLSTCGPVLLGGDSGSGGHEFVCDGYDKDGYFHINWGWGGMSNGYFLLTALDPGQQGIGGSAGGYNFSQDAIIGIRKPVAGSKYVEIMAVINDLNGSGGNASVTVAGGFVNRSFDTFSEGWGLGLEINGAYYQSSSRFGALPPSYYVPEYTVPLSGLPAGTYKAYPAFKTATGGVQRVKTGISSTGWLNLTVSASGVVTVSQPQAPSIDITDLKLETPMSPGNLYRISATAVNNGSQEYVNTIYPILVSGSGEVLELTKYAIDVPAGESSSIIIQATLPTGVTLGSYTLYLAEVSGESAEPISAGIPVTVEQYVAPALSVSSFTIDDAGAVDAENITVHATVSNPGGYFYGQLRAVIFPYVANQTVTSVGAITSPTIEIPANASAQEITFSGAFQAGEVGKEYFMVLYNGNTPICEQQPLFTIGTLTGIEGVGCDSDISWVEIYNASGVRVAAGTDISSAESLSSSTLPAGIYIMVYVHTDGHRTSQKFIKR